MRHGPGRRRAGILGDGIGRRRIAQTTALRRAWLPTERRAEVSSTYFVVAYVAISLPVLSRGFAAQRWGLQEAGVSFAVVIAVLAAVCLGAVLWQERRRSA